MNRSDPRVAWSFTIWDLPRDHNKAFLGVKYMGRFESNYKTSTRVVTPPQGVAQLRQKGLLDKVRKMMSGEAKRPKPEDLMEKMLRHPQQRKILAT